MSRTRTFVHLLYFIQLGPHINKSNTFLFFNQIRQLGFLSNKCGASWSCDSLSKYLYNCIYLKTSKAQSANNYGLRVNLSLSENIPGLPKQQTAKNHQREKRTNEYRLYAQHFANYFFAFFISKVRHFQIIQLRAYFSFGSRDPTTLRE